MGSPLALAHTPLAHATNARRTMPATGFSPGRETSTKAASEQSKAAGANRLKGGKERP